MSVAYTYSIVNVEVTLHVAGRSRETRSIPVLQLYMTSNSRLVLNNSQLKTAVHKYELRHIFYSSTTKKEQMQSQSSQLYIEKTME